VISAYNSNLPRNNTELLTIFILWTGKFDQGKDFVYSISNKAREISKKKSYSINKKFEKMLTSFFRYIKNEKVDMYTLKAGIKGVIRLPTIYEDDEGLTSKELKQLDDVPKFMYIVRSYCTFFNFSLLEDLMGLVDYKEGLNMLEAYKKDFKEYLKEIFILEIPHGIGIDREDSQLLVIELSDCFKSCRASYIDILKEDLCRLLDIKEDCLQLTIIKENSVHVVFQAFQSLENIFPLNEERKADLKKLLYEKAQIASIGYEGIVYNINREGMNWLTVQYLVWTFNF